MKQYLDLLKDIKENGVTKESGRENMPNTIDVFGRMMRFNLQDGFPLLTTKKISFNNIVTELLWFLRGDTNLKFLVDHGCNIWNKDAYRWFLKNVSAGHAMQILNINSINDYVDRVKKDKVFAVKFADLGKIYGAQWRKWRNIVPVEFIEYRSDGTELTKVKVKYIDQMHDLINGLRNNPYGRRHIVSAWNPADINDMALPPCHCLFHFTVRPISTIVRGLMWRTKQNLSQRVYPKEEDLVDIPKFYLDCLLYQRSCDTFLGVPYNIASYALLTEIIASYTKMLPGEFIWTGGSTHLYENHMDAVNTQLSRKPGKLPSLEKKVSGRTIEELVPDDFKLVGYNPQPAIKAELSVGL